MNYRTIQLTNKNIGAVSVGAFMPLGVITRKVCCGNGTTKTFDVVSSGADTIVLNEKGYYDIIYSASLIAAAAGIITATLIANGESVYTISETVAEGETVNLTLPHTIRVFDNCSSCPTNNPLSIQIELGGVAITNGTSNLSITRVY